MGVEKILEQIYMENQLKINEIQKFWEEKKNDYRQKEMSKTKTIEDDILQNAVSDARLCEEKGKSIAKNYVRNELLRVKSQMTEQAISKCIERLNEQNDEQYFLMIKKLIIKNAPQNQDFKIHFNNRDIKRVPKNFIKSINDSLKQSSSKALISEKSINISGGFILSYNGIEENCSFEALINEKIYDIKEKLYSSLGREDN